MRDRKRMHAAYHAGDWQGFYSAVLAASAALEGLLFVALSVNVRQIMCHPAHAARAREVLGQLLSLLILAVLVLVPGQDRRVVGAELIAWGLVLIGASIRNQGRTVSRLPVEQRLAWIGRDMIFNIGTLLIPVAGITLIVGRLGGLYWLVPTVLIYLFWSLMNAWILVVQTAESQD
ncbi:MAG: hypothetical protein ACR2JC_06240 [Chloroflexota bacterium]